MKNIFEVLALLYTRMGWAKVDLTCEIDWR